jgi:hypothetical protein
VLVLSFDLPISTSGIAGVSGSYYHISFLKSYFTVIYMTLSGLVPIKVNFEIHIFIENLPNGIGQYKIFVKSTVSLKFLV